MKKISSMKAWMYMILILGSVCIAIGSYRYTIFPFGRLDLWQHKLLASVPNPCEINCTYIDYYRDRKDTCMIKQIISTTNTTGSVTISRVNTMTLVEWVKEKGAQAYIMPANTHILFEEVCYDFDTQTYHTKNK